MTIVNAPAHPADLSQTRAIMGSTFLRRLPPLPDDAPAELHAAWEDYHAACDAWYRADGDHELAAARWHNARLTEAGEIKAAVLADQDPAKVGDHLTEADRALRRTHAVARTRAAQVKEAASRLLAVAVAHRQAQLDAAQPAIQSAADAVADAERALRAARADLDEATELAAWWQSVDTHSFPSHGQVTRADRARAVQEAAGDYTVESVTP